jgi:hypothetical protein
MPKWTNKQLREYWKDFSKDQQARYGSFEKWKAGILDEVDENGELI